DTASSASGENCDSSWMGPDGSSENAGGHDAAFCGCSPRCTSELSGKGGSDESSGAERGILYQGSFFPELRYGQRSDCRCTGTLRGRKDSVPEICKPLGRNRRRNTGSDCVRPGTGADH